MFAIAALVAVCSSTAAGWGAQGHRLVALIAAHRLMPPARQNVTWLLGDETLADVSSWADQYLEGNTQTALWHYLNIPPGAANHEETSNFTFDSDAKILSFLPHMHVRGKSFRYIAVLPDGKQVRQTLPR